LVESALNEGASEPINGIFDSLCEKTFPIIKTTAIIVKTVVFINIFFVIINWYKPTVAETKHPGLIAQYLVLFDWVFYWKNQKIRCSCTFCAMPCTFYSESEINGFEGYKNIYRGIVDFTFC
jgi:hypothetical protein